MSKRRKILTELEIEEIMQNISDNDSEIDSDSSDSDTIIYSDHKESSESNDDENISDICMPSTSKSSSTSAWSSTVQNLTLLPFKAVPGLKLDNSLEEEIDFFRHYFDDNNYEMKIIHNEMYIMKIITEQTNLYQRSIYPEGASGARSSNYLPVTEEEMFVFFTLTILKGYIYNFIIYTGKDTMLKENLGLYGERVVKSLLEELASQGYHLYIDRFFMSPSLADELFGLQTNTCGTVMGRRKGMPENFPPPKMKIGEMLVLQKKNMNLTAFKDRREVLVISTMHDAKLLDTGKKDHATSNPIMKPECIIEYNKNMGGVDLSDAVIIQYPSFRKTVKWYKKLFVNIMDMAVFNANILFNKKQ
nr:piggyBac transposable element-derived protein 4-like [Parasteatoda tepidariorum]